ncbi:type II secretion system protein, partial [bacterium]|nr:type II secretion system protein [bacterium]
TNDGGFADGRSKASPDSEKIEQTATKLQLRNFSSVEQIQDSECAAIRKNSYRNNWIASSDLRPPRNDGGINNRKDIHDSQLTHCPLSPAPSPTGRGEKKAGFTLAETLITIGIIGVVAALTIPSLIQENQKRATVTKLQKGISVINQAYKLSFDEQGEPVSTLAMGAEEYFKQYWQLYIKMLQYCDTYEKCGYNSIAPFNYANNTEATLKFLLENSRTVFYTFDGLLYIVFVYVKRNDSGEILLDNRIIIDINGGELPNKFGNDVFMLERIEDGGGVRPYGYALTDTEINEDCSKTGKGQYCAEKIRRAGWRIEKDYPW